MRRSLALIALALAACAAPPAPLGMPHPAASPTEAVGAATATAPPAWRRLADIPTPPSGDAGAVHPHGKGYVISGVLGPARLRANCTHTALWGSRAVLPP